MIRLIRIILKFILASRHWHDCQAKARHWMIRCSLIFLSSRLDSSKVNREIVGESCGDLERRCATNFNPFVKTDFTIQFVWRWLILEERYLNEVNKNDLKKWFRCSIPQCFSLPLKYQVISNEKLTRGYPQKDEKFNLAAQSETLFGMINNFGVNVAERERKNCRCITRAHLECISRCSFTALSRLVSSRPVPSLGKWFEPLKRRFRSSPTWKPAFFFLPLRPSFGKLD